MTQTKLNRIGVVSLAAFYGAIAWGLSMMFGWPLLFLEGIIPGSGVVSFILVVLSSIIGGMITGAITALIYNFAATFMGGIVLEFEAIE